MPNALALAVLLAPLLLLGCTQLAPQAGVAADDGALQTKVQDLTARVDYLEGRINALGGQLEEQDTLLAVSGVNSMNTLSNVREDTRRLYNYLLLQCMDTVVRNGGVTPDPAFPAAEAYCKHVLESA